MSAYKRSFFDRVGPDASSVLRTGFFAVLMAPLGAVGGVAYGIQQGLEGRNIVLLGVAGAIVGGGLIYFIVRGLPRGGAAALQATLMPSGNSTPYETDFSYEMALAMKSDVKGALESFEQKIGERPLDAAVRLRAAEMYLSHGKPDRARELYRDVQRIPGVDARDDVTASYRLIDLYSGKLGDPGKSLSEFRRLIERYPNSKVERQAREALAALKKEMTFER